MRPLAPCTRNTALICPSGRIGVSRGDLTDGMVRQTQIDPRDRPCCIHPAGEVRPACPVPRTHFGHHLPYTAPPLPYYHPRAPTSTSPVSDCTVPCHVMVHPEYAYSSALLLAHVL